MITMNSRVLSLAARSLYFRRRLVRDLPNLEETLRAELVSRGLTCARLGGYIVRIEGQELLIERSPSVTPGQLPLPGVENE